MRFLILTLIAVVMGLAWCSCARAPAPPAFAGVKVTCLDASGKPALSAVAASVDGFAGEVFTLNVAGGKTVQVARGTATCIREDMTLQDMQAPPPKPPEAPAPLQPPPTP